MENSKTKKYKAPLSHLLNPGHSACAGCGMIIAARLLTDTIGSNSIMSGATGCSEVTTTQYPMTSFKIPWIHSLFENSSSLATGISATLKKQGREDINVVAVGGDGATFDIGIGIFRVCGREETMYYMSAMITRLIKTPAIKLQDLLP